MTSSCIICFENFKYNDSIIACRCKSLIHYSCFNQWKNCNTADVLPCIHCQQYGTSYVDIYNGYYTTMRLR